MQKKRQPKKVKAQPLFVDTEIKPLKDLSRVFQVGKMISKYLVLQVLIHAESERDIKRRLW